jgi:hypothetical protein
MCENYYELEFQHFVVVTSDGTIFGCARENGHVYNFIIRRDAVQTQNGGHWQDLDPDIAHIVRKRAETAYATVPTFRISRLIFD